MTAKQAAGPWTDEPESLDWKDEATGLNCAMRRNSFGAWCGYVEIPASHPLHGLKYMAPVPRALWAAFEAMSLDASRIDLLFDVHGSVTYSGALRTHPDTHWYGFDCSHSGDLCPNDAGHGYREGCEYRDVAYVQAECASLARQISNLAAATGEQQ